MAEAAVQLALRTDGADLAARERAVRNVVAIIVRPHFTAADMAMLDLVPVAPRPARPFRSEPAVRRAKPQAPRNRIESRFLTDATRELYDRLGPTKTRVVAGAKILRWDLGEGDGILVARKSSEESKSGETIGGQLDALLKYCDATRRKPRIVIALLNLSGRAQFESRLDFTEVFESFVRGEISWVVYRGLDRVARSVISTAEFVRYLQEYGIGLHIAQLNKEIDLLNHFELSQLWMGAVSAESEWAWNRDRWQTSLDREMRDGKRMWSGSGGFGFTRNAEGFVVVDNGEWAYVIIIHELYATLQNVREVREALDSRYNIHLSQGTIHKILKDERYINGRIRTKDDREPLGYRVDTVHLERPVPADLWQRNQTVLAYKRGKTTRTPEGRLLLRGIRVYHARCMNPTEPTLSTSILAARYTRGKYVFHHCTAEGKQRGYMVPDTCRGYSLPADLLEHAVLRAVRTILTDDDALHQGIALGRANLPLADRDGLFTTDDRRRLTAEVSQLQRYRDGLWQQHIDKIRANTTPSRDFLQTEDDRIQKEIEALNRQLTVDTQLRRRERHPTPVSPDVLELLSDDCPADPDRRLRRWAIVQQLVSRVVVHDTEAGLSIELFGPLVPSESDARAWEPGVAIAATTQPSKGLPRVPEPFRSSSTPERLDPAYRWRCDPAGAFAAEDVSPDRFVAAIRAAAAIYPYGALFGQRGVGRERWQSVAAKRGLSIYAQSVSRGLARAGTDADSLIKQAVGREALSRGRVGVRSGQDAAVVLGQAIVDGLSFSPGWRTRAIAFGRDKPYSLTTALIRDWASRYYDGDVSRLIDVAQREVADRTAL
ncbi:MAG: recombinase family protein [Solirubrobacteraceae bacterium]